MERNVSLSIFSTEARVTFIDSDSTGSSTFSTECYLHLGQGCPMSIPFPWGHYISAELPSHKTLYVSRAHGTVPPSRTTVQGL